MENNKDFRKSCWTFQITTGRFNSSPGDLERCQGEIIKKPCPLIRLSTWVLLSNFAQTVYEVRHLSSLQRASAITLNAIRCLHKGPWEFPVGGVCGLAVLCAAQIYGKRIKKSMMTSNGWLKQTNWQAEDEESATQEHGFNLMICCLYWAGCLALVYLSCIISGNDVLEWLVLQ